MSSQWFKTNLFKGFHTKDTKQVPKEPGEIKFAEIDERSPGDLMKVAVDKKSFTFIKLSNFLQSQYAAKKPLCSNQEINESYSEIIETYLPDPERTPTNATLCGLRKRCYGLRDEILELYREKSSKYCKELDTLIDFAEKLLPKELMTIEVNLEPSQGCSI